MIDIDDLEVLDATATAVWSPFGDLRMPGLTALVGHLETVLDSPGVEP